MEHNNHMYYESPAKMWKDALPLGNGRLGAMVYGETDMERIPLNDDSLWYGLAMDRNNPAFKEKLPEIRRLMLEGKMYEAEEMISQYMAGVPSSQRHYTFIGQLNMALNQKMPFAMGGRPKSLDPEAYRMDLDLMSGILTVDHKMENISYNREMFVSHPGQVMCIRLTADTPEAIRLELKLDRVTVSDAFIQDDRRPGMQARGGGWPGTRVDFSRTIDDNTFLMAGNDASVEFAAAFRVECDGKLVNPVSQLTAECSSEVVIYLATATSNRFSNPRAEVVSLLDEAQKKGYQRLKEEHIKDFTALMESCRIDLGKPARGNLEQRLSAVKDGGEDPALAALYFQFGRYLIVSGSRKNSSALNLQGIWNADFVPMWDSKYTININLQMNYWPAWVGNLMDLHEPVMDLLETMHEPGKKTASVMYGMRGMVCHHNTDYYGDCAPQDIYMASTPWVTGGAWMGMHVWEHYLFTRDKSVLARMYPILKDMALFYEDFLMEVDGQLLTCPSVSPENRYYLPDGSDTPLCVSPTMDNQLLREFFGACIEIQKILGTDLEYGEVLKSMIEKLPGDQIGSWGQLMEWNQDYPEQNPGMGHVSHLYAVYPGYSINWRDTPELMDAAKVSLESRKSHGAGNGGWPLAWQICLDARFRDRETADKDIRKMLTDSTSRSLLNAGGVFQIDGNLGAAAGIAECLLQSHMGLHFLPALPVSWKEGSCKGLLARGGHEVDLCWENGSLSRAVVRPRFSGEISVIGEELSVTCKGKAVAVKRTEAGFTFEALAGEEYELESKAIARVAVNA